MPWGCTAAGHKLNRNGEGENMDTQGITADKKTVFDLKFFIKWGIAIGVPCILYFAIPQTEAVSLEMRKFFVCTAWAILTWAMNLLPVYISGLLLTVGAILWGVAPANVVLSPWTGSVVWLSLGGLTLSVIFEKSGLMQLIAYFFIVKSGGSYTVSYTHLDVYKRQE